MMEQGLIQHHTDAPIRIQSASLSQFVQTEQYVDKAWVYGPDHLSVEYSFELIVDAESGSDGGLAPDVRVEITDLPTRLLSGVQHTRLDGLGKCYGWFGNDAPSFDNVELTLEQWLDKTAAEMTLRASYTPWQGESEEHRTIEFRGPVVVTPLTMDVREIGHGQAFLERVFGKEAQQELQLVENPDRKPWGPRNKLRVRYTPISR